MAEDQGAGRHPHPTEGWRPQDAVLQGDVLLLDGLPGVGCRSGARSMNVCMFLKMNGFEQVKNLQGGIMNWAETGMPVG